jgi:hypothetical protein
LELVVKKSPEMFREDYSLIFLSFLCCDYSTVVS